ncbi:hypothetical protein JGU70_02330 [Rhodococcus pyridinivorans]|nr:hypothetical protein JGU70_02330 [Rhodococcus pyridinivorans]
MQHLRDARVVDAVHARPVEFVREVGVEHRFVGLQRHALVDERPAADTGGAQGRHVLADARLDQTGVGLEGEVTTEHLGVRPVPQEPLIGVVDAKERRVTCCTLHPRCL